MDSVSQSVYVPSTTEKKRAIACFFFMGILMSLVSKKSFSVYEYYYLSSSIGRWTFGLFIILILIVTLILPIFLLISLPLFIAWLVIGALLVRQAWSGSYDTWWSLFRFLSWIGSWMLSLFDVELDQPSPSSEPVA